MIEPIFSKSIADLSALLPRIAHLSAPLERLAQSMLETWSRKGKVLIAGNGGSAADAMHFAEELTVRYQKNRRALAAMALTDPTIVTCAANDFGYEAVFSRQIEAFGNAGDIFVGMTTSGNSPNILRAVELAKKQGLLTCSFLGRDGGQLKGVCDIELLVPSSTTARVQECHKLLYHILCEWIESQVD